ncbi:MAG: helix-turn-helix transcriptional regulator [Chloroflexi bacterium]|nr:helix-turn-helix transcriptional regulator [Chloroflexota bacterium]
MKLRKPKPSARPAWSRWLLEQIAFRPGLTQAELAAAIGVRQQRISEWITGRKRPRERNCLRLAQYFGVESDVVMALAGHSGEDMIHTAPPQRAAEISPIWRGAEPVRAVQETRADWQAHLPIPIPVYAMPDVGANLSTVVGYQFWEPAKLAGRSAIGIRLPQRNHCCGLQGGDIVILDTAREPVERDIIVTEWGGKLSVRRYTSVLLLPRDAAVAGERKSRRRVRLVGTVIQVCRDLG